MTKLEEQAFDFVSETLKQAAEGVDIEIKISKSGFTVSSEIHSSLIYDSTLLGAVFAFKHCKNDLLDETRVNDWKTE